MSEPQPNAFALALLIVFFGILLLLIVLIGGRLDLWSSFEAVDVWLLVVFVVALVVGIVASCTKWGREP